MRTTIVANETHCTKINSMQSGKEDVCFPFDTLPPFPPHHIFVTKSWKLYKQAAGTRIQKCRNVIHRKLQLEKQTQKVKAVNDQRQTRKTQHSPTRRAATIQTPREGTFSYIILYYIIATEGCLITMKGGQVVSSRPTVRTLSRCHAPPGRASVGIVKD